MSTATITPQFTAETPIGEIVAFRPALARVFERLGVDYCCGGKQPLSQACARRGLDIPTTLALLKAAGEAAQAGAPVVDAAGMTLTQLADHIEQTHHVYVKTELHTHVHKENSILFPRARARAEGNN